MSLHGFSPSNLDSEMIEISDPSRLVREPLVSVLMLAYKHGSYLAQAIESVLMQKAGFGIELIIGEDCSPDNTMEIALEYQRRYPNLVRIITSPKNVGMMENLQRAIRASRGQFLAFCEGDDYWSSEEKIHLQVAALQKEVSVDLSFHSCYSVRGASQNLIGPFIASKRDRIFTTADVIRGGGGFMPTASIMVRKSAVSRIPKKIFEKAPVGDYVIQVYGSLKGGAIYTNKPMCVYRIGHAEAWSSSINEIERIREFESSFNRLLQDMDTDIKKYRASFTRLIFRYNLAGLGRFQYRREDDKANIYYDMLTVMSPRLSAPERLVVRFCRNRSFCIMIRALQMANRRCLDLARCYPFNSIHHMHSKRFTSIEQRRNVAGNRC